MVTRPKLAQGGAGDSYASGAHAFIFLPICRKLWDKGSPMLLRRLAPLVFCLSPLLAQDFTDPYGSQEEIHVAFGLSAPLGTTGENLDWGFLGGLGGTFWVQPSLGIHLEGNYQRMLLSKSLVQQHPPTQSGTCEVWSLLLHGVWHAGPPQQGFYLMAGGGAALRRLNFVSDRSTSPSATGAEAANWAGLSPGSAPPEQVDTSRPALSVGLGWETRVGSGTRLFIEARYLRIFTRGVATEMAPLVIGTRW